MDILMVLVLFVLAYGVWLAAVTDSLWLSLAVLLLFVLVCGVKVVFVGFVCVVLGFVGVFTWIAGTTYLQDYLRRNRRKWRKG